MRQIYILVIILLSGVGMMAQGIEFINEDLAEAKKQAAEQEKIIFVDAYTTWCGPCKRLSKDVFPQKVAGDFYNTKFINLKLDMEKGDGPSFATEYGIRSYPTLLFITSDGELVMKSIGGRKVEELIETGKTALKSHDFSSKYAAQYNQGKRDFELIYNYVKSLNNSGKSSLRISNDYFRNNENRSPDQDIKLLSIAVTEADSKLFDLFIENQAEITAITSDDHVRSQVIKACAQTAKKAKEYESIDLLNDALKKAGRYVPKASEEMQAQWVYDYFVYIQDVNAYVDFVDDLPKRSSVEMRYKLGLLALTTFFKRSDLLNNALKLVKSAARDQKKDYRHPFLMAKILIKQGDTNAAAKAANQALQLADKYEGPSKEINELIESI